MLCSCFWRNQRCILRMQTLLCSGSMRCGILIGMLQQQTSPLFFLRNQRCILRMLCCRNYAEFLASQLECYKERVTLSMTAVFECPDDAAPNMPRLCAVCWHVVHTSTPMASMGAVSRLWASSTSRSKRPTTKSVRPVKRCVSSHFMNETRSNVGTELEIFCEISANQILQPKFRGFSQDLYICQLSDFNY